MGTQEYRANYRAAMQEANSQLAEMFREFEQLQLRKELIEDALGALEPFLEQFAPASFASQREPVRYEPELAAPAAPAAVNEPVAAAPFSPLPEVIVDPIQSRINRALGLAVA